MKLSKLLLSLFAVFIILIGCSDTKTVDSYTMDPIIVTPDYPVPDENTSYTTDPIVIPDGAIQLIPFKTITVQPGTKFYGFGDTRMEFIHTNIYENSNVEVTLLSGDGYITFDPQMAPLVINWGEYIKINLEIGEIYILPNELVDTDYIYSDEDLTVEISFDNYGKMSTIVLTEGICYFAISLQ